MGSTGDDLYLISGKMNSFFINFCHHLAVLPITAVSLDLQMLTQPLFGSGLLGPVPHSISVVNSFDLSVAFSGTTGPTGLSESYRTTFISVS